MQDEQEFKKNLERFLKLLNRRPAGVAKQENYEYIPIDVVETRLDQLFFGLWQTTNFHWNVISNELVGSIDLQVYHPIAKIWITKTGVAGKVIMQDKDASILDAGAKKKNALELNFPTLKSDCIKNACKSLGGAFGRKLNRKSDKIEEYQPLILSLDRIIAETKNRLLSATTLEEVAVIRNTREVVENVEAMHLVVEHEAKLRGAK